MMEKPILPIVAMISMLVLTSCESSPWSETKDAAKTQSSSSLASAALSSPQKSDTSSAKISGGIKSLTENDPERAETQRDYNYSGSGKSTKTQGFLRGVMINDATKEVTLSFEKVEIKDVVDAVLGQSLGLSYVIHPAVSGTITLSTKTVRGKLIGVLSSALKMNGVGMVWDGDAYQILPAGLALQGSGGIARPPSTGRGGSEVRILPLSFMSATEMSELIGPVLGGATILRADDARNLLILSGIPSVLDSVEEAVSMFDVNWLAGMSVAIIGLSNAKAPDMLGELQQIFGAANGIKPNVRFVAIERLNAILVISSQPEYIKSSRDWVAKLDKPAYAREGEYVYRVRHGNAKTLLNALKPFLKDPKVIATDKTETPKADTSDKSFVQMAKGQNSSGGGANKPDTNSAQPIQDVIAIRDDNVVITAIESINAIIISASPDLVNRMARILDELDQAPRQVLIEVTVAEVTLTDEMRFGLEWFLKNDLPDHFLGKAAFDTGVAGAVATTPGFSYAITSGKGVVRGLLDTLASQSNLKILASPQLLVQDRQKASIQVGNQVPIVTRAETVVVTGTADRNVNSVEYRDTGVILSVTPRVSGNGEISLDVNQEVSQVIASTSATIDSPTFSQRSLRTNVTMPSGETLFIGGLIQDSQDKKSSGIPLLKDIPGLGYLFSSIGDTNSRTELVILITPKFYENANAAGLVEEEMRRKIKLLENVFPVRDTSSNALEKS